MTKGGDGGPGVTSEQASAFNQKRIESGSHIFLDKNFQETVKIRMTENNPMKNPDTRAKCAIANSAAQKQKVLSGTHYLQSEASRQEKIKRMAFMKSRPIVKEVRDLFIKAQEPIPRSLHTTSDAKLLIYKERLEQKIANIQVTNLDLFSVC